MMCILEWFHDPSGLEMSINWGTICQNQFVTVSLAEQLVSSRLMVLPLLRVLEILVLLISVWSAESLP